MRLTPDTVLGRSKRLVSVLNREGREGVANASLGAPLELNDSAWDLLELFAAPTTPRAVAETLGGTPALEKVLALAERFLRHGLLVEADEERFLLTHGRSLRLPHLPALVAAAQPLFNLASRPDAAHFAVVGVPFDRAARFPGAARAPSALRRTSAGLPTASEPRSDESRGFWDAATGSWRLRGARFADLGDVVLPCEESFADAYERVARTLKVAFTGCAGIPVVLGGDHSVTWPAVRALAETPIYLVQFDAHADRDDCFAGDPHLHGNVVSRLLNDSLASGVLQVGVRDASPAWRRPDDRVTCLGAYKLRGRSPADVLEHIPQDARCYVTIDIDVLDPSAAPATGVPLPAGLELPWVEEALEVIGAERQLVGVDIVEVAPDLPGGWTTQVSALRLLVRLCDGHLEGLRRAVR